MDGWEDSGSSDNSRWKSSKSAGAARTGGSGLAAEGQRLMSGAADEAARNVHPVQYKRGGKVRRTGRAVVHKGERVIPRSKVKRVEKMMRGKKMRMTNRGRS